MSKVERLKAITYLNEKGAFLISKSSEKIAEYFNISKFTLYSDLKYCKGRILGGKYGPNSVET